MSAALAWTAACCSQRYSDGRSRPFRGQLLRSAALLWAAAGEGLRWSLALPLCGGLVEGGGCTESRQEVSSWRYCLAAAEADGVAGGLVAAAVVLGGHNSAFYSEPARIPLGLVHHR